MISGPTAGFGSTTTTAAERWLFVQRIPGRALLLVKLWKINLETCILEFFFFENFQAECIWVREVIEIQFHYFGVFMAPRFSWFEPRKNSFPSTKQQYTRWFMNGPHESNEWERTFPGLLVRTGMSPPQMNIRQQRKLSLDRWPNNNENSINKPFIERTVRETPASDRAVDFRVIY